jgi:hypothetical protein
MKKCFVKVVIAALSFIAIFAACQKEMVNGYPSNERATLRISVPMDETKVISDANDAQVNHYQVFLFKDDYSLEDYTSQTSPDVTLDCTMGRKYIVAMVNAPSMGDVLDYRTLTEKTSLLSDNSIGSFVMEGLTVIDIATTDPAKISVPVTRKVAKVELSSLTVAIDMPQYSSLAFKVSSVYLINVSSEIQYFPMQKTVPVSWTNQLAFVSEDANDLTYDDMGDFQVTESTPYTTKNTFYTYANLTDNDSFSTTWSPRHTRLVVEAMLGDQVYYYPVTLPKLEQNKVYGVNLKITRPGSFTPDARIDKFDADFQITVKDWVQGETVNEEI